MKGIFGYDSPLMTALTSIGDCICLSVLWILFSLPIVTLGPSTAALYSTAYRVIRKKEGGLWRHFWSAFTGDLRRNILAGLAVTAVIVLLTVDVFVMRSVKLSGGRFGDLYYVVLVLWCLGLTWGFYAAAYGARFNGSVREVLKFGMMLMALHPIKMLGVLLPLLAGAAMSLLVPFMLLVLPAAVTVIGSFATEGVFRLHMRPEDLERELAPEREDEAEETDDE